VSQDRYDEIPETAALLAFGANIRSPAGAPEQTLTAAMREMGDCGMRITRRSGFFRTPCMPAGAGPDFVNAAVLVEDAPEADALLATLHRIEARFGRERGARWAARTLDIDLLARGAELRPDKQTEAAWRTLPEAERPLRAPDRLILPHPRLAERAFVLVPLAQIAPGWRHPATGLTVAEMLAALPDADKKAVTPL